MTCFSLNSSGSTATVLCRSVGLGPDVHETSMGSVTDLAVGSGAHISFCLSKV